MGALRTCCGYYCASVALVGVYFFILMAIMEFKGNTYVLQVLQRIGCPGESWNEELEICCAEDKGNTCLNLPTETQVVEQPDPKKKGTAFLIMAGIELVLTFGCYWCGGQSASSDAEKAKAENEEYIRQNYTSSAGR